MCERVARRRRVPTTSALPASKLISANGKAPVPPPVNGSVCVPTVVVDPLATTVEVGIDTVEPASVIVVVDCGIVLVSFANVVDVVLVLDVLLDVVLVEPASVIVVVDCGIVVLVDVDVLVEVDVLVDVDVVDESLPVVVDVSGIVVDVDVLVEEVEVELDVELELVEVDDEGMDDESLPNVVDVVVVSCGLLTSTECSRSMCSPQM